MKIKVMCKGRKKVSKKKDAQVIVMIKKKERKVIILDWTMLLCHEGLSWNCFCMISQWKRHHISMLLAISVNNIEFDPLKKNFKFECCMYKILRGKFFIKNNQSDFSTKINYR